MGTYKENKDDCIKIRVNKELKNDFKAYTERNNSNMSEVLTQYMVELLVKEKSKVDNQEMISRRSATTEIKIAAVKEKKFSCTTKKEKKLNLLFRLFKRLRLN